MARASTCQEGQPALAVVAQSSDDTLALGHMVEHPDRTKAKALAQLEGTLTGRLERIEILLVFESQFNGLNLLLRTGGEIGDGAVFDFAILTKGLTEEDALIGFAFDGDFTAVQIHSEHNLVISKL